jgi:hypothetical protein
MAEEYVPLRAKRVATESLSGKRISHIQFGTISKEEVERSSEFEVITNKGYEQPSRTPVTGGVVRHLKFKLHDGDGYVENAWASTVFRCSRGLRLLDYAEKVARAHIVGSSRQLEVELCVPFKTLWDVDLDTTLQVSHPELPGGQIIGKVIAYQLRVTSDSWLVWVKLGLKAPIDAQKANGDCQQKVPVAAEFVTDYVTDYLERDEGESCGDGAAMAMVQERVKGDIVTNKTYFTQWPLVKVAGEVALDPSTFRLYDLVESIAVKGDGAEQIELLHKAQYPASMHYKEALKGETFQLAVQFMDLSPKQVCQTRWERGLPIVVEV